MLIFYALPQSPYCTKVRAALKLKEIAFEEREPEGGSYQTTEYQQIISAGSVPAIRIDDWWLHDSQAILEFLEERWPTPSLWNKDIRIRAKQRSIIHFHDTRLEPKVRELVAAVKQPDTPERNLEVGVIRDNIYDRLFRLNKLITQGGLSASDLSGVVAWTLLPTIGMGRQLLEFLASSMKVPVELEHWCEGVADLPLVEEQVSLVSDAISLWLVQESNQNADQGPGSFQLH